MNRPADKDKVRAVLFWLAEEIPEDGAPPLRLPPNRRNRAGIRLGTASEYHARWLAPLAAAAAMLVVMVLAATAATLKHPRAPLQHLSACGPARSENFTTVPRYFIAVTGESDLVRPQGAAIFSTATARPVATIRTPPGLSVYKVSAAADDVTFAIATVRSALGELGPIGFYLVRFDAATRSTSMTRLAVPPTSANSYLDGLALSPDGRKLAVAYERSHRGVHGEIRVLNICTGTVRTWSQRYGSIVGVIGYPETLNWAADDTTLAMNYVGLPHAGLRLLDTSKPSTPFGRGSRLVLPFTPTFALPGGGELTCVAMLTPDAKTVVGGLAAEYGGDGGIAEWSARTGVLKRKLDWRPMLRGHGGSTSVLWSDGTGRTLVVYSPPGHFNRLGILHGNRLTLLPVSPDGPLSIAAW